MKNYPVLRLMGLGVWLVFGLCGFTDEQPYRIDFSGLTDEENQISVQGASFGTLPKASIRYGAIPTDHDFPDATDGEGAIIEANPGEGVLISGPIINTTQIAQIRCSVRADHSEVSIYLATIDQGKYTFVSTLTPNNGEFFLGKYKRISNFFLPPSEGFRALIQVVNTSKDKKLTVYLDNWDVLLLEYDQYYQTRFLDGDEKDPAPISVSEEDLYQPDKTPIPRPTFFVIQKNTPTPTPKMVKPTVIIEKPTIVVARPTYPLIYPTFRPPVDVLDKYVIQFNDLPGAPTLTMQRVEMGTFLMGSPYTEKNRQPDESPQHWVTISKTFYLGKYEMKQDLWTAIMGYNPSLIKGNNLPVTNVNWYECQIFLARLNQKGRGTFRLPTEAEWEYACRSDIPTAFYWGTDNNYTQIYSYAWFQNNSAGITHPVGLKLENDWELADMSGNLWEWCSDWYGNYTPYAVVNPQGATYGPGKVLRGGSWYNKAQYSRSANRTYDTPYGKFTDVGFRIVREIN